MQNWSLPPNGAAEVFGHLNKIDKFPCKLRYAHKESFWFPLIAADPKRDVYAENGSISVINQID